MERSCKCHGLSGSCTMRTCWRVTPPISKIGIELKRKYTEGVLVDQSNLGNGKRRKKWVVLVFKKKIIIILSFSRKKPKQNKKKWKNKRLFIKGGKRKDFLNKLVYYEPSPSFCEAKPDLEIAGTMERQCNLTSTETDDCSTLCCGRGYDRIMRQRVQQKCRFEWCCEVKCVNETINEEITVCK